MKPARSVFFVFALLLLAACSSRSSTGGDAGVGTEPAPAGTDLLDFRAPLLDGGTLDGTTLAGKDVAFWFWAPW